MAMPAAPPFDWREPILKRFSPTIRDAVRVSVVADPDQIMADESVVDMIRAAGFDLLVHDEGASGAGLGFLLSQLQAPEFPVPLGVFRQVTEPAYEDLCADQADAVRAKQGIGRLDALLQGGAAWTVAAEH